MKKSQLLHFSEWEAGSALSASGSFAQYHFQLYDINPYFLLALRAVQRKFHKDSILIHLRSCFTSADWTMNPQRVFLIVTHFYTSDVSIALRLCAWLVVFPGWNSLLDFVFCRDISMLHSQGISENASKIDITETLFYLYLSENHL